MSDDEITRMAQVYHRAFSTEDGRAVLADLAASYQARRSFVQGDAYATAFREGQRDVYLAICQLIARARNPKEARPVVVGGPEEEEARG